MGNNLKTEFRAGEIDVALKDMIDSITENEFMAFKQNAEDNGIFDEADYPTKESFLASLPNWELALKTQVINNLKEGKDPFA